MTLEEIEESLKEKCTSCYGTGMWDGIGWCRPCAGTGTKEYQAENGNAATWLDARDQAADMYSAGKRPPYPKPTKLSNT